MHRHYYMTHPVHGRLVTLDPHQVEQNKEYGWTLEDAQPQEQPKRGPGRPKKVNDEHGAASH